MENKFERLKSEVTYNALDLGIPLSHIQIVWDPNNAEPQRDAYAMHQKLRETAKPQEISFWNRVIEKDKNLPKKPKTQEELHDFIKTWLYNQKETGYKLLVKAPVPQTIQSQIDHIKNLSLEEAAVIPQDWQNIRNTPQLYLEAHITQTIQNVHAQRCNALKEMMDYLLREVEEYTYSPSEAADILSHVANTKYHADGKTSKIDETNQHIPEILTGGLIAQIVEKTREGMPTQNAILETLKKNKEKNELRGENTGWRVFKQSAKMEDAELLASCADSCWCTSGKATAQSQLQRGNFYIYMEKGKPKLAIRTEKNIIAEVRGVGRGQTVETPELEDIAYNFIKSEEGPIGGENYFYDIELRKECAQFNKTGKLTPFLLQTCFMQTGDFVHPNLKMGYGQLSMEYVVKLKDYKLKENELITNTPEGKILNTRYTYTHAGLRDHNRVKKVEIEYCEIKGEFESIGDISAPNLLRAGNLTCRGSLNVPNLKEAKHLKTENLYAPKLKKVGNIDCTILHAENLEEAEILNVKKDIIIIPKLRKATSIITNAKKIFCPLEEIHSITATKCEEANLTELKFAKILDLRKEKTGRFLSLQKCENLKSGAKHIQLPQCETLLNVSAHACTHLETPKLQNYEKIEIKSTCNTTLAPEKIEYFDDPKHIQNIFGNVISAPSLDKETIAAKTEKTEVPTEEYAMMAKKDTKNWYGAVDKQKKLIYINSAVAKPFQIRSLLIHELGHLAYESTKPQFNALYNSLSPKQKKAIEALIKTDYKEKSEAVQEEEKLVATLEILASTPESKPLFQKWLEAIEKFWNQLTNKAALPKTIEKNLIQTILKTGIASLQNPEKKHEEMALSM